MRAGSRRFESCASTTNQKASFQRLFCFVNLIMNNNYIELIGWIGFLFIIYGYYLNAKRKSYCFYIWGIGNIVFVIYATLISSLPMLFMSVFTIGMNIYGLIQWNKN